MSAEGIGLSIGFATTFLAIIGLFVTLVNMARANGLEAGMMREKIDNAVKTIGAMDTENRDGHEKLFDCLKATDVEVGKIGQRLESMNGSMKRHNDDIERLKTDSHRDRPDSR